MSHTHRDLSQPAQSVEALVAFRKMLEIHMSVLDNHCCQKFAISDICLDVE
jgi:hypothetical protein